MKVLIWISTFLVFSILNVILGYALGFKLGVILLYLAWYFAAKKLCELWDDYKARNKKKKMQSPQLRAKLTSKVPPLVSQTCEEFKGQPMELSRRLAAFIRNGTLSQKQADALFEIFAKPEPAASVARYPTAAPQTPPAPQAAPTEQPTPQFCRSCGSKLEENAKFCNHCGTAVTE